ncbi:MAG: hypothetical protein ACTHJ8_15860 [Mucilaginibacter sp.]|jgi:hypothetical protein
MMTQNKKGTGYLARLKYLLMLPLIMVILCISTDVFAQNQPSQGPPPPPPPPNPLSIFKKHKKDTTKSKKADTVKNNQATIKPGTPPPGGPPPPPNPLNLFKKKKKDTTKTTSSK